APRISSRYLYLSVSPRSCHVGFDSPRVEDTVHYCQAMIAISTRSLRRDMGSWVKWIGPYLKCFGQRLSAGTVVEIDDDGRASEMGEKDCPMGIQGKILGGWVLERGGG